MVSRQIDPSTLSRRALFRGGSYLFASGLLTSLPFVSGSLFAHDVGSSWPNLAAMAEKYINSRKVANLLISIGKGQEDISHTVGGGTLSFRNSQEVDLNTLFRIYSMTKPITGMGTMMLIDDGRIKLDQPLAEILPEYSNMRVLLNPEGQLDETVPAETPITIRHLLTHTAGLGYVIISKGPLLEAFYQNGLIGAPVSRFPIPGLPEIEPAPSLAEFSVRLSRLPLVAHPGKKWIYSASIDVLGRVIEVVTGQNFEAFLLERVFEPCGMDSTFFKVPESEVERLTTNYGVLDFMPRPIPIDSPSTSIFLDKPSFPSGGGGLVSSPRDYDRFLRMLMGYGKLDGRQVMSETAVRVGISNLLPDGADLEGSWMQGQGHGAGGRSVGTTFGWGGAAGTLASVDFATSLRIGLFTQYMPSDAYPVRQEFIDAVEKDMATLQLEHK